MAAATKTRSILIDLNDGRQVLVEDIPATAKVTFGKLQPGRDSYALDTAVRIYTSANNQLAVFRNAVSFRDLSLSVKLSELTVEEEYEEVDGPNGRATSRKTQQNRRLVPPAVNF